MVGTEDVYGMWHLRSSENYSLQIYCTVKPVPRGPHFVWTLCYLQTKHMHGGYLSNLPS